MDKLSKLRILRGTLADVAEWGWGRGFGDSRFIGSYGYPTTRFSISWEGGYIDGGIGYLTPINGLEELA